MRLQVQQRWILSTKAQEKVLDPASRR